MIKDILKEKEAVAYLSLKNDLTGRHLAHSYLLYGELNPLKKETAFLLAQSIIEGKDDFACEQCNTCRRIRAGKYFDVIYIDGYKESIKKEQIERVMDEMSKTSLESSGRKVYIIDNINNSSIKVLNMILKFMEEPGSDDIYGILISDNIDTLLETVVSRCQKIPFMARDFSALIKGYEEQGYSHVDAYLLSHIKHELADADEECFLTVREYVYKTIENLSNKKYLPVLFAREFYPSLGKEDLKEGTSYFLDIFLKMLEDVRGGQRGIDDEYDAFLDLLEKEDTDRLLEIFLTAKDRSLSSINRNLLFDQIAAKIIS